MKFYLCDQKKCKVCHEDCQHTSDLNHALHPNAPYQDFARIPTYMKTDENGRIVEVRGEFVSWEKNRWVEELEARYKRDFDQP